MCTPFLGAGVNYGILPLGAKLALMLADKFGYPFKECDDLAKVAQFVALDQDPLAPRLAVKEFLADELEQHNIPALLIDPEQPLSVLADLPLPIYMTTNYDNLMFRALQAKSKTPTQELCRWNSTLKGRHSVFDSETGSNLTENNPLVFHLHGYEDLPQSMVLTEDDYVNFLVNLNKDDKMIPSYIEGIITGTSLLFIGYALEDWNFKVIFRGLVGSMEKGLRPASMAVQLTREDQGKGIEEKMRTYMTKYFENLNINVYWGTAREFVAELKERWGTIKNDC